MIKHPIKHPVRIFGRHHLHFITFSCYRRMPLLRSARSKNVFVEVLAGVRQRYGFALVGFVVMPEHVHLLFGEPTKGTPSTVIQVLKQSVSRRLRRKRRRPRISCGSPSKAEKNYLAVSGSLAFTTSTSGASRSESRNCITCT